MDRQTSFNTLPKPVVIIFFCIGVVSAISFRILIVFRYHQQHLFRTVWYIGIIGYIFFFLYRALIARRRRKMIRKHDLIGRLSGDQPLDEESRNAVRYIINSLSKSRENYNYYIIFFLSIVAVVIDMLLAR